MRAKLLDETDDEYMLDVLSGWWSRYVDAAVALAAILLTLLTFTLGGNGG